MLSAIGIPGINPGDWAKDILKGIADIFTAPLKESLRSSIGLLTKLPIPDLSNKQFQILYAKMLGLSLIIAFFVLLLGSVADVIPGGGEEVGIGKRLVETLKTLAFSYFAPLFFGVLLLLSQMFCDAILAVANGIDLSSIGDGFVSLEPGSGFIVGFIVYFTALILSAETVLIQMWLPVLVLISPLVIAFRLAGRLGAALFNFTLAASITIVLMRPAMVLVLMLSLMTQQVFGTVTVGLATPIINTVTLVIVVLLPFIIFSNTRQRVQSVVRSEGGKAVSSKKPSHVKRDALAIGAVTGGVVIAESMHKKHQAAAENAGGALRPSEVAAHHASVAAAKAAVAKSSPFAAAAAVAFDSARSTVGTRRRNRQLPPPQIPTPSTALPPPPPPPPTRFPRPARDGDVKPPPPPPPPTGGTHGGPTGSTPAP